MQSGGADNRCQEIPDRGIIAACADELLIVNS